MGKNAVAFSLPPPKNERQQRVNNSCICIMDTQNAVHRRWAIIKASAAFISQYGSDNIATTS